MKLGMRWAKEASDPRICWYAEQMGTGFQARLWEKNSPRSIFGHVFTSRSAPFKSCLRLFGRKLRLCIRLCYTGMQCVSDNFPEMLSTRKARIVQGNDNIIYSPVNLCGRGCDLLPQAPWGLCLHLFYFVRGERLTSRNLLTFWNLLTHDMCGSYSGQSRRCHIALVTALLGQSGDMHLKVLIFFSV